MPGPVKSKIRLRHVIYVQHRRLTLPMIGIKMCMHLLQSVQLCMYVHTYIRKCSIYTHALYVHVCINYIYIQYVRMYCTSYFVNADSTSYLMCWRGIV